MAHSHSTLRSALLASVLAAASSSAVAVAADGARIVFRDGKSIAMESLTLQGDKLVVKVTGEGFSATQAIPLTNADHLYGIRPAPINQAIALLLMGKPKNAKELLLPVVAAHRISAKIPGNFWLEAARALLVAHAVTGEAKECTELGKEISDATPIQGIDPFVTLGKALLMAADSKVEEREAALRDLANDNLPADVCGYATFFRAQLYQANDRAAEALTAYLEVPGLYPSGGLVIMAMAELRAAELLTNLKRIAEATALLQSAIRDGNGTAVVAEAEKALESLK